MAEAFLRFHAIRLNLDVEAQSAGTIGAGELNQAAVEAMREIGIPIDHHEPKTFTAQMVAAATHIVSMGCGVDSEACPTRFLITEDWALEDPAGQPIEVVRRIRNQIEERVLKFLERPSFSD